VDIGGGAGIKPVSPAVANPDVVGYFWGFDGG